MIYLLDADSLIRADRTYYPPKRFPVFWEWLRYNAAADRIKIPFEQYHEIVAGRGELVEWLKEEETKVALLLDEEADQRLVVEVTKKGYAPDLDDSELEKIGRDPFLIAYAYVAIQERVVVTLENSAPKKQRANRKIPDVCKDLGVGCRTLFELIDELDFTTKWNPGLR